MRSQVGDLGGAELTSSIVFCSPSGIQPTSAGSTSGGLGIHYDGNRSSSDPHESSHQTAICQPLPSGAASSMLSAGFAEAATDPIWAALVRMNPPETSRAKLSGGSWLEFGASAGCRGCWRECECLRAHASTACARTLKGCRRRPHVPGGPSNTPAHGVPQASQRPSPVRFQRVRSYQSRPISRASQE